jgi:A/G-specific adenine glycosylase
MGIKMTYDYSETVEFLLDWYDMNARILVWRSNPRPYYVWVSEIMLQQTRVEAVKGYFDRFIHALPDINSLAIVDDDYLMKLWEGLGYYSRARSLKKAAIIIMQQYDGELPANYAKLLDLPGIGAYTAGAISSIAYQLAQPAVDGNVLRVMKRIAGSFDDISKEKVKKELEVDLRTIMPKDRPGDFNQAIMELGATVCIPNGKPLCTRCPLMHLCKAFKQDLTNKIPVKPKKKERTIESKTIFVLEYEGKFAIRKRVEKGLLHGLWELPNMSETISYDKLEDVVIQWNLEYQQIMKMGEAKHIFSHREWHMIGYFIKLTSSHNLPFEDIVWANEEELKEKYSLPTAFENYKQVWNKAYSSIETL